MNQPLKHDPDALPKLLLPSWVFDRQVPDWLEDAAFSSGAALSLLHVLLNDLTIGVPVELLRSQLALRAAVHCSKIEGRAVTEADIRDAYILTLPGDAMGPDGDKQELYIKALHRPNLMPLVGLCQFDRRSENLIKIPLKILRKSQSTGIYNSPVVGQNDRCGNERRWFCRRFGFKKCIRGSPDQGRRREQLNYSGRAGR